MKDGNYAPVRTCLGPEMRDNAIHEAGHAVIAIRLGLGLGEDIALLPEGIGHRPSGYQEVMYGHTTTGKRGSKEDEGVFTLAGMVAEQHFNREAHDRPYWAGDRASFWELFPVEGESYIQQWTTCESRARELVHENESEIEAVATALLSKEGHALSPKEVVDILEKLGAAMNKPKDPRGNMQLNTLNPVAIKAGQSEVNAPEHETWGTVACDECGEQFFIGPNRLYPDDEQKTRFVKAFEKILSGEHKRGEKHRNSYDLGW